MKRYGINTLDKVLSSNDGWVKESYNYYDKVKPTEEDMLTYDEVVKAFAGMYNEVYAYLNNGQPIIKDDSYSLNFKAANTIQSVILALQKEFEDEDFGVELTLPATATVKDKGEAKITWTVDNGKYASIENNVLKGKFDTTDDGELEITLNFEVELEGEKAIGYGESSQKINDFIINGKLPIIIIIKYVLPVERTTSGLVESPSFVVINAFIKNSLKNININVDIINIIIPNSHLNLIVS